MAGNILPISTVINVSVATPQQGVGAYNTSNLAIFSNDTYGSTFGTATFKIYLSPTQVGIDFGTTSATYLMAVAIFAQQPNILAANGYLVVIPLLTSSQVGVDTISFPGIPASGTFKLTYAATNTGSIAYNASAATIQTDIQGALTGLGSATVSGAIPTAANPNSTLVITFTGVSGLQTALTVTSNSLEDANSNSITPTVFITTPGSSSETFDAALNRTANVIQYFGAMTNYVCSTAEITAAAAVIQTLNKIAYFTSYTVADAESGGKLAALAAGGYTQSRALPYFETVVANQPATSLEYMAAYASLGLSTNFNGSLTTQTMNLKTLSTIAADPGLTATVYTLVNAQGSDVYASIQGVPKVLTSGTNDFYDNQYNLQWFSGALQVAYFNALATVNTKVPQTENGMDLIKSALRAVCQQAVANGFLAPGAWNSSTYFGNQANLIANVAQYGYYIYSSPIAAQLQASRVARQAPLIQIAAKYAGAVQSGTVVVYVNQ